jgi:hypothetical protein
MEFPWIFGAGGFVRHQRESTAGFGV